MRNKGIVIWLSLLTAYILWGDVQYYKNIEIRKEIQSNTNERFKNIEEFINGPINDRINHIEEFLGDNSGEKKSQP